MNEEIKNYIREWTGNKGDNILLDLKTGTTYIMDNKEYEHCPLCLNNTFQIHEHHRNKDRADNSPENLMRICEFCHLKGIHGQAFKLKEVGMPEIDEYIDLLLEGNANDNLMFSEKISGSLWIDFMETKNLEKEVEEIRYYIRHLIGVWLYENSIDNKQYRMSPSYDRLTSLKQKQKLMIEREMYKAKNIKENESRKSNV